MVFSVSRDTGSQVLYRLLCVVLTPGSASSQKNHCCTGRVRQLKAASKTELIDSVVWQWGTQRMHLSITATSMREEQLTEKVDTLEGHFCSAIARNPEQCHISILATMQKTIRCRAPVSLLQQLRGKCQALGHTLPGSDLLLPQPHSISVISHTSWLKMELARGWNERRWGEKQTDSLISKTLMTRGSTEQKAHHQRTYDVQETSTGRSGAHGCICYSLCIQIIKSP